MQETWKKTERNQESKPDTYKDGKQRIKIKQGKTMSAGEGLRS